MIVRLDKWYFDCQTTEQFGYYYVSRLRIGNLGLIGSEVHHYHSEGLLHTARLGVERRSGRRKLQGGAARLEARRDHIDLRVECRHGPLQGTWQSQGAPLIRLQRPLYRDQTGWCDWKVWMPQAKVSLTLPVDGQPRLQGTGYVDMVRFALPFWRIPLQSVCWGRLFAGEKWIVLFRMESPLGVLAGAHEGNGWQRQIERHVIRNADQSVCAFDWQIDSRRLRAETVRVLARGPILNQQRLARWVPMKFLQRLASGGHEEKYWVQCSFQGTEYAGPMEEVRWHCG